MLCSAPLRSTRGVNIWEGAARLTPHTAARRNTPLRPTRYATCRHINKSKPAFWSTSKHWMFNRETSHNVGDKERQGIGGGPRKSCTTHYLLTLARTDQQCNPRLSKLHMKTGTKQIYTTFTCKGQPLPISQCSKANTEHAGEDSTLFGQAIFPTG